MRDFGKLLAIEPRLTAMFPPRDALYADYVGVFSWSAARYRPGPYRGTITFYWARDEPGISRTWQPVTGPMPPARVQDHVVAGDHMSCIADHLEDTAAILGESLRQVEEETSAQVVRP